MCFIHITSASAHDVNGLYQLFYEPDSYYIFDKGYIDFKRLYLIHQNKSYYVTRAKDNMNFKECTPIRPTKRMVLFTAKQGN
ncbi:MAG: transposase [Bacteroidales bacterium]